MRQRQVYAFVVLEDLPAEQFINSLRIFHKGFGPEKLTKTSVYSPSTSWRSLPQGPTFGRQCCFKPKTLCIVHWGGLASTICGGNSESDAWSFDDFCPMRILR